IPCCWGLKNFATDPEARSETSRRRDRARPHDTEWVLRAAAHDEILIPLDWHLCIMFIGKD
ncbi:MAG: hypothetical protein WCE49_00035, partial [Terrimicrobiaceae bacterium]